MDTPQHIQEGEYRFPYHYIVEFGAGRYTQSVTDTWGVNYAATAEFLLERLADKTHRAIVDIGCGDGRLAREIALRFSSASVCGIDYSERAIGLARAMNSDLPSLRFVAADITQEEPRRQFDCATLVEVLEHIPPDESSNFLAGISRLLEPGADLYVTVPHANRPIEPKHFRHFTVEDAVAELGRHFDVVQAMPFERATWSRWLLARIMHNRMFALTNRWLLDCIYAYHRARLFYCRGEHECQRIFIHVTAR